MTTTDDLRGILGPAYDTATDDQLDRLARAVDVIDARYGYPDEAHQRAGVAAVDAAVAVILGEGTLEGFAGRWQTAKATERQTHAELRGAIIATDDTPTELSRRTGLSRESIYKAKRSTA